MIQACVCGVGGGGVVVGGMGWGVKYLLQNHYDEYLHGDKIIFGAFSYFLVRSIVCVWGGVGQPNSSLEPTSECSGT